MASPEPRGALNAPARALRWGALFVCALAWGGAAAEPVCAPDRIDERVRVAEVFDGDTLRLEDGRKLRLVGINTPEMGRGERRAEDFAHAARRALLGRIRASGYRISLRYDSERHDRYARLLAHAYTREGANLAAALLREGLAVSIAVPPNLWHQDCYRALARAARERGAGVWSLARYQGLDPGALRGSGGFFVVRGRVLDVGESRSAVWLDLRQGFALRLAKDDLIHFRDLPPRSLRGRVIRVSGWARRHGNGYRMRLRHPAQLEIID